MRYFGASLVLTVAALSVTGCGQFGGSSHSSSRGGTAVVDLDKVAAETGRNRQLAQTIEMAGNSLNQQLAKTVENAKEQLEAKKKGYSEEMTDAEQKELVQWTNSANSQLMQIQNQAKQKYEQFKQEQIAQFRAEVKPIAQEIASKRGLSIVIPKNEGLLLSVDPGIDITDDVIKVLREKHPVPAAATAVASSTTPAPEAKSAEQAATPADADQPRKTAAKRNPSSAKPAGAPRSAKSTDDAEAAR